MEIFEFSLSDGTPCIGYCYPPGSRSRGKISFRTRLNDNSDQQIFFGKLRQTTELEKISLARAKLFSIRYSQCKLASAVHYACREIERVERSAHTHVSTHECIRAGARARNSDNHVTVNEL